ncbi:chaplin family protein [Streptomyces sp. SD31]|uniref:chaplin n=1 Tax=Streptomyces sp. SD31 TaxID=3452208 RepID=UPI003F8BCD9D
MRQVTRKGLMTVAAATGVIAAAGGAAHATGSGADGSTSNSPGVLSGNTVQAPLHVPVNVCGNTVNVVGVLNPASGNSCANQGGGASAGHGDSDGGSGASSGGHTSDSPGIGSGNHVEAPVHVPVNVCGNSVDVIGVGNSVEGNDCTNGGGTGHTPPGGGQENPPGSPEQPGNPGNPGNPEQPGNPETPGNPGNPQNPDEPTHPGTPSTPPSTGGETPGGGSSDGNDPGAQSVTQPQGDAELAQTGSDLPLGLVLPVGAGALLAGSVLYRKARTSA